MFESCDRFGNGNVKAARRRANAAEDEGWLLGFVVDEAANATDLVIVDAADFAAPPRASIRIPHRIPLGFHGNFRAG